jgi:hypothetical protein
MEPESTAQLDRSSRRTPDFYLVGHPKSGTTAMVGMLRQHPDIELPPVRSTNFFVDEDEVPPDINRVESIEAYCALFADVGRDRRLGERTLACLQSRSAAQRISAVNPDARIVAIIREPASFVRSLHLNAVRQGVEPVVDLREALRLEPHRARWQKYLEHARYVDQLQRFHTAFPPNQVVVVIYDDYRTSNTQTMREVFALLDVDTSFEVAPMNANPAFGARSLRIAAMKRKLHTSDGLVGATVRLAASKSNQPGIWRVARRVYQGLNYTAPPPEDPELMAEIRTIVAPEVERLSEYLDRDFIALWGYS